ncbi:MAG: Na(+)/H(+) antiporter subunit B [Desulfobacteraceae bacterium]
MKIFSLIIAVGVGCVLLYATGDFPSWGDPASPASTHVSPHYLEKALEETSVPNIVTAVLADYRGYDTMFETTVIFAAGAACVILLRLFGIRPKERYYRHLLTGVTIHVIGDRKIPEDSGTFERIDNLWVPHDMIIRSICRFLIPFIQLFALYVIAHGHHSPGGGFQGGVILGASVILMAISMNLRTSLERIREKTVALLAALGILIYSGTGALCILLGGNYLDYSALAGLLRVGPVEARSLGILAVEIGVGVAVMATMIAIYQNLASSGRLDEGL